MNMKSQRALQIFLASVLLLISCDVSTFAAPQQIPSPVPGAINFIVAQTAAAAATQTAAFVPPTRTSTFTPFPTQTPSDTPTATATFIFSLVTPTLPNISGSFVCNLISQVPENGANFKKNKSFTMNWVVANSGSSNWLPNQVSLKFTSGDQFTNTTLVQLPKMITPGNEVTLSVDMITPNQSGNHMTYWSLMIGDQGFCPLALRITVRN